MTLSRVGIFLCTALALLISGCATTSTTSSQAASSNPNTLRVGVATDLPPLIFKSEGQFKGMEADFARALAADLGKTLQFVEVPWEKLTDALLDNKIDIIMSGMTITQARLMRVNFTKPYIQSGQTILVRRSDSALIQMTLFDPKTRVGAQSATTGDYWVLQNCSRSDRKLYSTAQEGAKALISKKLDAFVCDAPVNWWLASEYEAQGLTVVGGYLTEEYLAWAIRKEDSGLLESANTFIDKIKEDGELQSIIKTWVPYQ